VQFGVEDGVLVSARNGFARYLGIMLDLDRVRTHRFADASARGIGERAIRDTVLRTALIARSLLSTRAEVHLETSPAVVRSRRATCFHVLRVPAHVRTPTRCAKATRINDSAFPAEMILASDLTARMRRHYPPSPFRYSGYRK